VCILSAQSEPKHDLWRALLGLAGVSALLAPISMGVVRDTMGGVQPAAQAPPQKDNIAGTYPAAAISGSCWRLPRTRRAR
jgi:hypothetical protein